MTSGDSHFVRKLGKVESFFNSLTRTGKYNNFALIVKPDSPISIDQIHHRLHKVLSANPILASNIIDGAVHLPNSVAVKQIVESWDPLTSVEELSAAISVYRFTYGYGKQLFRIFISGEFLVLVMDHSLFDGSSLVSLARKLVLDSEKSEDQVVTDAPIYTYSSDHQEGFPQSFETLLNPSDYKLNPDKIKVDLEKQKSGIKSYGSPHHFRLRTIPVPTDFSVSLTSKAEAAWVNAISQFPEQFGHDKNVKYLCGLGVDARKFLQTENSVEFGCYSTGFDQPFVPDCDVKPYSDELRFEAKSGSALQPFLSLFEEEKDWDPIFLNANTAERDLLGVTNIGKLDFNGWFVQPTFNLSFIFNINITRVENELRLIFTMVDNDVVDTTTWEAIIDKFGHFINH